MPGAGRTPGGISVLRVLTALKGRRIIVGLPRGNLVARVSERLALVVFGSLKIQTGYLCGRLQSVDLADPKDLQELNLPERGF